MHNYKPNNKDLPEIISEYIPKPLKEKKNHVVTQATNWVEPQDMYYTKPTPLIAGINTNMLV